MLIQNTGTPALDAALARLTGASPHVEAKPAVAPGLPQAAAKLEQQPSAAELKDAMDGINKALKQANINLEFSVDADTRKSVVKVMDAETGDTIRQFPSKEALAIFRAIDQVQQGLLLKQKA